jgi:hypothetical protein
LSTILDRCAVYVFHYKFGEWKFNLENCNFILDMAIWTYLSLASF